MQEEFAPETLPPRGPLASRVRQWLRDLLRYSRPNQPPPPRGNHMDRAVYGAAQPLLGVRLLFTDWSILREALVPAAWLAAACAVYAGVQGEPWHHSIWLGRLKEFYKAFALLAPIPSVIFANHYARFAAQVRYQLGFGACGPREMPITKTLRRTAQQALLVSITFAPMVALAHLLPFGGHLGDALLAMWALNWVVLEAFDDANVLQPGQTLADVEREAESLRRPWFVRMFRWMEARAPLRPAVVRRALRVFGNLVDRLSKPWREESALLEASPRLGLGFSLSTAAILTLPILNLVFRPAIIAGATHLLGHIEKDEHAELPEILHEHAPPRESERSGEKARPIGERYPDLGNRF